MTEIPWWHFLIEPPFYIHLGLEVVGLLYAIWAYNAAERAEDQAKEATTQAQQAAENAKIQSTVLDISQLITSANNIDPEITFVDATSKCTELASKIRKIIMFYKSLNDDDLNSAAAAINTTIESLRAALTSYDSATGDVYRTVEPHFAFLSIYISEYSGVLERKQINQR